MTDTLTEKLAALRELRAAMTPGEWGTTQPVRGVDMGIIESSTNAMIGETWRDCPSPVGKVIRNYKANATGITATHNAADALIAVAEAAAEVRRVEKTPVSELGRFDWAKSHNVIDAALDALQAALSD